MASDIRPLRIHPLRLALAGVALLLSLSAPAAELLIAHIAPFTGPAANEATAYNAGVRLAFKAANANGGVAGHQLALQNVDDQYNPDRSVALFNDVGNSSALATILPVGSAAMTRVLAQHIPETLALPVIGVVPAIEPLRTPNNPFVFHTRASDFDQYRRLIDHAIRSGLKRVAVVYADIPFGTTGATAIEVILKSHGLTPATKVAIPVKAKTTLAPTIEALAKSNPDMVILISPSQLAGEFVKAYRERGLDAPLATPSYGDPETVCRIAGATAARGLIVAQVMPNIGNTTLPLVRRYQDDLRRFGEKDMRATPLQFEGYVTAQVLIEGIRKAGPRVDRQRLVAALDNLKSFDLGGYPLEFTPARHTGASFVDVGIIGRDCKLIY